MIYLVLFVILALAVLARSLKKHRGKVLLLPVFAVSAFLMYGYFGSWHQWNHYLQTQKKQQQIQALLAKMKSPEKLITKLKAQLDNHPSSARGWYLLGRLYVSQNRWQPARDAFAQSLQLQPDEATAVNYALSLWQLNQRRINADIRNRLQEIIQNNPDQPDALAMLAMDAYEHKQYSPALTYWRRLLKSAPENSEEAQALKQAIAQAEKQKHSGMLR